METFYSNGGTIGDALTTIVEVDPGELYVQLWDSGNLKDDAFDLNIDGFYIGSTAPGQSNLFSIETLASGNHSMDIVVRLAPDDVGTYTVRLFGGATFAGGAEVVTASPPEGTTRNYTFTIP
jgi:hypothetical protein